MDIRKHGVVPTGVLHLRDANDNLLYDDGKAVEIELYGPGSKQYAAAQSKQANATLELIKKKGNIEQSSDQKIAANAEFLTTCTVSFNNIEYNGLAGKELYHAVYSDPSLGFIADQVAKFIGDWSNFTKQPTKA